MANGTFDDDIDEIADPIDSDAPAAVHGARRAPGALLQVFCANPDPGIPDDGTVFPVVDGNGMVVGYATRSGDRVDIKIADESMFKRLSGKHAAISVGYSLAGKPLEIADASAETA